MHENDQATSALSKVSSEPVLGAVPQHAEPSASCNTHKYATYAEIWQPSFSRLHAASIEPEIDRLVEIGCILADHDFASERAIAAEENAKTLGALETPSSAASAADSQASSAAAATAGSQASHLPASTPAIRIDAGFFKSYAQHIKAQRSILCKTSCKPILIQPATSNDCEDDLENRFKLRRGRTCERDVR
jgi:hypothetical protein